MEILYIPVGVPTFHQESAKKEFDNSVTLLKSIDENVVVPNSFLLSIGELKSYIDGKNPNLVIFQNVTFANGAFITEVLRKFPCPVLLWTLREPVIDGTRLRLNSLTGAFSAGNALKAFNRPFEYVLGSPNEDAVKRKISATVAAVKVKEMMKSLNILQIGHTPDGFGFGRALDMEIATVFGSNLLSIEARELIETAKKFTDEEVEPYLEEAKKSVKNLDKIDKKNVYDFARLFKAYKEYVESHDVGALSSRCWPDFFTSFGTPVCTVLALLNDLGVSSSCEADTYGALSMYIGQKLSSKAVFFGDPVALDEKNNTVTFWHCGTGACSLARTDTGAEAGMHCNRKIGPTLEFGCKAEKEVTVFRVGRIDGKIRFFIAHGEALDMPKQFYGTSVVVRTANDAGNLIKSSVCEGWEPHFAVVMANVYEEIKILGNFLNIEVIEK